MTLDELIAYHANELDNLRLLKSILDSGDCNICAKKKNCRYCPNLGQQVRFNCPHYMGTAAETKDYTQEKLHEFDYRK